jgi:cell division protein FtsZ
MLRSCSLRFQKNLSAVCLDAFGTANQGPLPLSKMIELTRTHETHSEWNVKVLGVGGAGTHAVDRLTRDGLASIEILAANTDARALSAAATTERIVLGHRLTRGLGAGGDPELGRAAAEESLTNVGERLAGASLVILLAGLGGGTGSGATPAIAQIARAQGSHVAVFATLPFSFEGRRRREQALEALDSLREHADFVVCFENDRMPSVADPASGIEDAFESVDSLLAQAVRAVTSMTRRRNVMHSGIDEIASTVAEPRSTALFGYGVADGEERARAAVARAFANPLLDAEGALHAASRLWVYVAGGPDMRWSEVQTLMGEITERVSPEVRLFFGAAVDPSMAGAISVTLLAGIPGAPANEGGFKDRSVAVADRVAVAPMAVADSSVQAREQVPAQELRAVVHPEPLQPVETLVTQSTVASLQTLPADLEHEHRHDSPPVWQDFPPPVTEISATKEAATVVHAQAEPELLPLEELREAQSHVRATPIPPYELSKERRREAALHESATKTAAFNAPTHTGEAWQSRSEVAHEGDSLSTARRREEPAEISAPVAASHLTADHSEPHFESPSEVGSHSVRAETTPGVELESALPLNPPRENGKRSKDGVQEQMRFEAPHRGGRFEKTDPTIVDGEDLDVPTFMRQRLPIE